MLSRLSPAFVDIFGVAVFPSQRDFAARPCTTNERPSAGYVQSARRRYSRRRLENMASSVRRVLNSNAPVGGIVRVSGCRAPERYRSVWRPHVQRVTLASSRTPQRNRSIVFWPSSRPNALAKPTSSTSAIYFWIVARAFWKILRSIILI